MPLARSARLAAGARAHPRPRRPRRDRPRLAGPRRRHRRRAGARASPRCASATPAGGCASSRAGCTSSACTPRSSPAASTPQTRDGRAHLPGPPARARPPAASTRARGTGWSPSPTEPTREALHNVYTPGPAILAAGDQGLPCAALQARLAQLRWWSGDVTGVYDARTIEAVRGFQAKRRIPVTGEVDRRTLDRLAAMTRQPTKAELFNIEPQGPALDPRCMTGRAMCVDKTSRSLRWVVDGVVQDPLRRAVRLRRAADPRGGVLGVPQEPRPRVQPLRHLDAVRDVLLRRPGGALLPRLRGHRLQRRLARVRQRARLRRRSAGSSTRCTSATR